MEQGIKVSYQKQIDLGFLILGLSQPGKGCCATKKDTEDVYDTYSYEKVLVLAMHAGAPKLKRRCMQVSCMQGESI